MSFALTSSNSSLVVASVHPSGVSIYITNARRTVPDSVRRSTTHGCVLSLSPSARLGLSRRWKKYRRRWRSYVALLVVLLRIFVLRRLSCYLFFAFFAPIVLPIVRLIRRRIGIVDDRLVLPADGALLLLPHW